jgi:hypothetical protein
MPNWCYNNVEIAGSNSDLQEIAKRVSNANSFLEGLYPLMNDDGSPMDYNYDHWVNCYGTKWNDELNCDPTLYDNNRLTVSFQTAWSPPLDGLISISQLWPSCVFGIAYTEPGMCFAGVEIIVNGIVDLEDSTDYPDFGDWESDPDGCSDRQSQFEESIYDSLCSEMDNYKTVTKVTML